MICYIVEMRPITSFPTDFAAYEERMRKNERKKIQFITGKLNLIFWPIKIISLKNINK